MADREKKLNDEYRMKETMEWLNPLPASYPTAANPPPTDPHSFFLVSRRLEHTHSQVVPLLAIP